VGWENVREAQAQAKTDRVLEPDTEDLIAEANNMCEVPSDELHKIFLAAEVSIQQADHPFKKMEAEARTDLIRTIGNARFGDEFVALAQSD
jgi:hypothetical protein